MHLRWSVLSAVLVFCSCAAKVWNTARCTSEMECVKLKCSFCFSNALYAMQHNASVTVKCSFESSPVHNASVLSAVLSVLLPPPRYRLLCSTLRVLELLTTLNSGNATCTLCSRWVVWVCESVCVCVCVVCIVLLSLGGWAMMTGWLACPPLTSVSRIERGATPLYFFVFVLLYLCFCIFLYLYLFYMCLPLSDICIIFCL